MQFSELIGQQLLILIPTILKVTLQNVKIVGSESGGIWIESQAITNHLLQSAGVSIKPTDTHILCAVPQIGYALFSTDSLALNEKAFGLQPRYYSDRPCGSIGQLTVVSRVQHGNGNCIQV